MLTPETADRTRLTIGGTGAKLMPWRGRAFRPASMHPGPNRVEPMPIYEYQCVRCEHLFSMLRPMRDAELPCVCPECGETDSRRLLSLIAAPARSDRAVGPTCAPSGG